MSEPNGDAPTSSPSSPAEPSGPPSPTLPSPLTPAPRANPPSVFNQKEPLPAPPPPAGFQDFLAWVQAFSGTQTEAPQDGTQGQRSLLPKEKKKFRKFDPETAKAESRATSTEAPGVETDDTFPGDVGHAGQPGAASVPVRGAVMRKRRQKQPAVTRRRIYTFLLPWLIGLVLLVGSFLLGRETVPKAAPVFLMPVPRVAPDHGTHATQVADLIDQAMTAESETNFAKAADLLRKVQGEKPHVAGIDYHLALLAFEDRNLPRAMSLAGRSIDEGEEVAACFNLRGLIVGRTAGITRGFEGLEMATQLDPYNAKYFYFLGEALRRAGKPQAALVRLRQASARLREPALDGLYQLKIRLTQIEIGQENVFAAQLQSELQRPSPPLDWLVTAAALEMHRGHFDAAAGYLDKVVAAADQQTVDIRLRDYFLYGFAHEKSLARFYSASSHAEADRVSVTILDVAPAPAPTTSPPANADASPSPESSVKP